MSKTKKTSPAAVRAEAETAAENNIRREAMKPQTTPKIPYMNWYVARDKGLLKPDKTYMALLVVHALALCESMPANPGEAVYYLASSDTGNIKDGPYLIGECAIDHEERPVFPDEQAMEKDTNTFLKGSVIEVTRDNENNCWKVEGDYIQYTAVEFVKGSESASPAVICTAPKKLHVK